MNSAKKLASRTWRHFMHDSLYRNSIYLMANTAILAGFGFVFWALAAHFYSTAVVGLVTTLVSIATLVMTLSTLGFDNTFIRFLPKSKTYKEQIDSGITITSLTAAIIGVACLAIIAIAIPDFSFVTSSVLWMGFFVVFMVVNMLNNLTNYVFIAYRITHIILFINLGFGIFRLIALVGFSRFGLNGLSGAYVGAVLVTLLVTFLFMKKTINYTYSPRVEKNELSRLGSYASGSYLSSVFLTLPTLVLPTIVLAARGPSYAAYYYIISVIIVALDVIPEAAAHSLFAEGSWDNQEIKTHLSKALKILVAFLLPASVILIAFGKLILSVFGKAYVNHGYSLLVILVLSVLPRSFSLVFGALLRIRRRVGTVARIYAIYAAIVLVGCLIGLFNGTDLMAVGYATLGGEVITALAFGLAYERQKKVSV